MMEHKIFRVALFQGIAEQRSLEKNTNKVIETMEQAKAQGAHIVLLPECFLTGYELPIDFVDALEEDSIYLQRLKTAAKQLGIGVVATAFTKGAVRPQNSAYVIDKQGRFLLKYSKVHTCDFADEKCLEHGREFKVCDFDGIRLGIMICYDREYPESARELMLKGAEIILVPNDCSVMKPRVQALSTRAYENMVGIAMSNPPGENAGNSCAFSPICWNEDGICVENQLLLADDKTEGIFYADFDMEAIRSYRSQEMMGNTFRRVEAYTELVKAEIKEPFVRPGQER